LVALSASSVGVYASESFDERSEVNGYDKVLIVELKRGGSKLAIDEFRQGEDYARELRKSGKVGKSTRIVVYVLGTEKSPELEDAHIGEKGETSVYARTYSVILQQAHARTFYLLQKLREVKDVEVSDSEVEAVIDSPVQTEMSLRETPTDYAYSLQADMI
jgi:hypothetical protein